MRPCESSFGQVLTRQRRAAGLTQEMLSERSGLSVDTISALERGLHRAPRPHTVALLADALGLAGRDREDFAAAGHASRADAADARGRARLRLRLPVPAGDLVGREEELSAAGSLLTDGVRLLTLTGPPGVGKTRLAAALMAARAGDLSPDGMAFVSLAPLSEPDQVGVAIGRSLGVRDVRQRPVLDQLAARIADHRALLVLDNFEHLLPASPLLRDLLARCPALVLVVTSRSALRLRDEQELPVAPLGPHDALTLFVRRARAHAPHFQVSPANRAVVRAICQRLDGLPLALELAAPWLRLLSPEELLARLDDRMDMLVDGSQDLPARQRTIRRTLEWSYDLLEGAERELFQRLSVFAGGASLGAVEAVWARVAGSSTALNVVAGLAAKNLVVRTEHAGESVIGMLETVREYAEERLAASGRRADTAGAHAGWCVEFVEEAARALNGPDRSRWLARLERELPNLRAALRWLTGSRAHEARLLMASRLRDLWEQGHAKEGLRWLEDCLDPDLSVPAAARAGAILSSLVLAFRLGDYERASALGHAGLALHRQLDDRRGLAAVLNYLAGAAWEQGRTHRAIELCEQSLALRRELGSPAELASSLVNTAILMVEQRDRRAPTLLDEALHLNRRLGDERGVLHTLGSLAAAALAEGRLDDAAAVLNESFARLDAVQDLESRCLALYHRGELARARGDLARAAADYRESLRGRLRTGNAHKAAYAIEGMAAVAWRSGDGERAAMRYGAVAAVREAAGSQPARPTLEEHAGLIAEIRRELGAERFCAAWAAGSGWSLADAAADVLDEG